MFRGRTQSPLLFPTNGNCLWEVVPGSCYSDLVYKNCIKVELSGPCVCGISTISEFLFPKIMNSKNYSRVFIVVKTEQSFVCGKKIVTLSE